MARYEFSRRTWIGGVVAGLTSWKVQARSTAALADGHQTAVMSIEFSPNGRLIATCGEGDHQAIVWDAESGKAVRNLPHGFARLARFSPDGKLIATAGYLDDHQGTVLIWETASGKRLHEIKAERWEILKPEAKAAIRRPISVSALRFSPDGKFLALGTNEGTVGVVDPATGNVMHVLRETLSSRQRLFVDYSTVHDLAFSPDSSKLATALTHDLAEIWDPRTGKRLRRLKGHTSLVGGLAWSPDGKLLATASMDKSARIWNPVDGKEIHVLKKHVSLVDSLSFRPDGARLVSSGGDSALMLWDPREGGDPLAVMDSDTPLVPHGVYSPDGKLLASCAGDNLALIWDPETTEKRQTLRGHLQTTTAVAWSPDGKQLATGSADTSAMLWDASTGRKLLTLGTPRAKSD